MEMVIFVFVVDVYFCCNALQPFNSDGLQPISDSDGLQPVLSPGVVLNRG